MKGRARKTAYLAVLTALGALLTLIANVLPAGRLALLAITGLPVCIALMMCGTGWAAGVFAVTAALSWLLFPGTAAACYTAFFGWYPIVKSLCERLKSRAAEWALKYLAYSAVFALYILLARGLFPNAEGLPWIVLYLAGAAAFALYDWIYSLLIRFYLDNFARFFP